MNKKIIRRILMIAAICAICVSSLCGCAALDSCSKSVDAYSSYLDRKVTAYHPFTGEIIFQQEGKMICNANDIGLSITTKDGYRYNLGNCTYIVEEKQ